MAEALDRDLVPLPTLFCWEEPCLCIPVWQRVSSHAGTEWDMYLLGTMGQHVGMGGLQGCRAAGVMVCSLCSLDIFEQQRAQLYVFTFEKASQMCEVHTEWLVCAILQGNRLWNHLFLRCVLKEWGGCSVFLEGLLSNFWTLRAWMCYSNIVAPCSISAPCTH